jgi:hypothetical protein
MSPVIIKVRRGNDIRRYTFDSDRISFEILKQRISKSFRRNDFDLSYVDDEGVRITVGCSSDILEGLKFANGQNRPLVLDIHFKGPEIKTSFQEQNPSDFQSQGSECSDTEYDVISLMNEEAEEQGLNDFTEEPLKSPVSLVPPIGSPLRVEWDAVSWLISMGFPFEKDQIFFFDLLRKCDYNFDEVFRVLFD